MRCPWFLLVLAALVFAAACTPEPDPAASPFVEEVTGEGLTTTLLPPTPTDPPAVEGPTIGELVLPCGRGGEASRTAIRAQIGIDSSTITIGAGNDRGGLYSFGSGRAMPDAVEVMAGHCNALGGLLGREVLVLEYDAAAVEVGVRTEAQCTEVVAVVGQGYLHADEAEAARELCGLPSFDGWINDLTIGDPVVLVGFLHAVRSESAADRVVLIGPDTASGIRANEVRSAAIRDSTLPVAVVASLTYPVDRAPDWDSLAEAVRAAEAGLVRIEGACASSIVPMLRAFAGDESPPLIMSGPSAYDHSCIAEAAAEGVPVDRLLVELPFHPIEDKGAAPVTARYVELLAEVAVEPTGDALLAASAFWRFAVAADACGQRFGRACLAERSMELDGWTGGGLHRTIGSGDFSDTCAVILGVDGVEFERRSPVDPGVYDCDPSLSGMTVGDLDE
jgi:hypothetical protein